MRFEMRLGLRTTITLPAASGAIPAPPASTPEPRGSDERLAIIVDPDTAAAEGMAATLVSRAYATQILRDASSTMDALSYSTPDLALINIELPDIDGIELIRSIRTRPELQALPIVAIAPMGDDSVADSLDAGATAYLVKPVSPSQIGHYAERLVHPL